MLPGCGHCATATPKEKPRPMGIKGRGYASGDSMHANEVVRPHESAYMKLTDQQIASGIHAA
jgi:hypothetical protein